MGSPKHLLRQGNETWLEHSLERLQLACSDVVIAGTGTVPQAVTDRAQLPDPPDVRGPLAGIVGAMRWMPYRSWIVTACDLPDLSHEALSWLLEQRSPGVWAVMPRLPGSPGLEPLLAYYDFRCLPLFEQLIIQGDFCPLSIVGHPKVLTPQVPQHLAGAWRNVNTPSEDELIDTDRA